MSYYNITEHSKYTTLPESYAGVSHYPMATYRHISDGFYPLVEFTLPDGYQKIAGTQTYTLNGSVVNESWQTQTDEAAETARQLAKTTEQKTFENSFLSLCDTLTGSTAHIKLDDATVMTALETLGTTDPVSATALMGQFLLIRQKGVQHYGPDWYDDVAWHEELSE